MMKYIGEKIKELRRKNDMTQEKLADMLSVSYQTVSKWECGISSPDVYTIAPLARLFGVTTDELLGVTDGNARRAEYDAAHENYWQKDIPTMYETAQNAVAEFPGDMKYLKWLASMEYYVAFDEDYRNGGSDAFFKEMLEKSAKHYKTVIENTNDEKLKENAISGIVMSLKYLERMDEAKKYAELVPKETRATRDDILSYILSGNELLDLNKKMLCDSLKRLLTICNNSMYAVSVKDPYRKIVLDAEEAILKATITDGNYLGFSFHLYTLYIRRAEYAILSEEYDHAISYLKTAREYAIQNDALYNTGKHGYTCPLLSGYEDEWQVEPTFLHDSMDYWNWCTGTPLFDPIRDREDFKALLE